MTSSSRGGEEKSGGVRSHSASSAAPVLGDVEALLGALVGGVVGLHQPVALEALERRVHLPDVERPHLAGAGLELLAQLQAVLGTLAEQGQQGVTDAHTSPFRSSILSILRRRRRRCKGPIASLRGPGRLGCGPTARP